MSGHPGRGRGAPVPEAAGALLGGLAALAVLRWYARRPLT